MKRSDSKLAGSATGKGTSSTRPESNAFVGGSFRPSRHALRFLNSFGMPRLLAGFLGGLTRGRAKSARYGLCGGMVFLTAGHFARGRALPQRSATPPVGHWLYLALVGRQLESLRLNPRSVFRGYGRPIRTYRTWMHLPDRGPSSTAERTTPELRATEAALEAGCLVPLGLVYVDAQGRLSQNHQVLAYGYSRATPTSMRVHIYDPNHPSNDAVVLDVTEREGETFIRQRVLDRGLFRSVRGFFVTPHRERWRRAEPAHP